MTSSGETTWGEWERSEGNQAGCGANSSRRAGTGDMAFLRRATTCLDVDPVSRPPRLASRSYIPAAGAPQPVRAFPARREDRRNRAECERKSNPASVDCRQHQAAGKAATRALQAWPWRGPFFRCTHLVAHGVHGDDSIGGCAVARGVAVVRGVHILRQRRGWCRRGRRRKGLGLWRDQCLCEQLSKCKSGKRLQIRQ